MCPKVNPLQGFLFGEQVQVFSYRESEGEEMVVNEECSSFLQIFLDVKHKDVVGFTC